MSNNRIKAFSLVEISVVILIIGVLIAGIAKGSRVIKHFKEASRENSAQGIAAYMQSLEGLRLWLDASAPNSFGQEAAPSDGATVTTWKDIISNYDNAHSSPTFSATGDPQYLVNGINGVPAIDFDGNDYFSLGSSVLEAGEDSYTIALVWNSIDTGYMAVFCSGTGATESRAQLLVASDHTSYFFSGHGNEGTNIPYSAGQMEVTIMIKDGTSLTYFANGSKYSSSVSAQSLGSAETSLAAPCNTGNSGEYMTGKIAEVIVFDKAITQDQALVIQDYLLKKYSIEKSS